MDVSNLAVPVIVGGIAGMTLSITGVKHIHDLCDKILHDVAHLEEGSYSASVSYGTVLYSTVLLIAGFFLSEICTGAAMLFAQSNESLALDIVWCGYGILIITLALMLLLYYSMLKKS